MLQFWWVFLVVVISIWLIFWWNNSDQLRHVHTYHPLIILVTQLFYPIQILHYFQIAQKLPFKGLMERSTNKLSSLSSSEKTSLFIVLIFLPMTVMHLNIHPCQRWSWKSDNHGLELRYPTARECSSHLIIHPSLQFKRIIHHWKFLQYLCQDSPPKLQAF